MSSQGCTLFRDSSGCVNAELFIIRPRCVYPCRENKKEEWDGEQLAEKILPSKTFTLSELRRKMLRSQNFLADLCSNMCESSSVVKVQKGHFVDEFICETRKGTITRIHFEYPYSLQCSQNSFFNKFGYCNPCALLGNKLKVEEID